MKKNDNRLILFIIPNGEFDGRFNKLEKLPNARVFVAAQKGSVEVLELVALFLLKTVTFGNLNFQIIENCSDLLNFRRCIHWL